MTEHLNRRESEADRAMVGRVMNRVLLINNNNPDHDKKTRIDQRNQLNAEFFNDVASGLSGKIETREINGNNIQGVVVKGSLIANVQGLDGFIRNSSVGVEDREKAARIRDNYVWGAIYATDGDVRLRDVMERGGDPREIRALLDSGWVLRGAEDYVAAYYNQNNPVEVNVDEEEGPSVGGRGERQENTQDNRPNFRNADLRGIYAGLEEQIGDSDFWNAMSREQRGKVLDGAVEKLGDLRDTLGRSEEFKQLARFIAEARKRYVETNTGDGEGAVELGNYSEQLKYARGLLDRMEVTVRTTRDPSYTGQLAATLERFSETEGVDERVKREIHARICLHDCSVLMRKANGYIERNENGSDPECPTVGYAATLAAGMNHDLDTDAINFLIKDGSNGIPVSSAWDAYQWVNLNYRQVLGEIGRIDRRDYLDKIEMIIDNDPDMGKIDSNYVTDSYSSRKERVDQFIIDRIMHQTRSSKKDAEKAWKLAKNLALATGEDSVFFVSLAGNDEMAEAMFLRKYREGRDESGRPRGPQIHLKKIPGIGNSWLRRVSGVPPYGPDGYIPLNAKDIVVDPTGNSKKPGIETGSYVAHFAVWWSGKIHPLRQLLLDRAPDPKKYTNLDFFQKAIDYFNKADPSGALQLRKWWIAGVCDLAVSQGQLGWTQTDLSRFEQFATKEILSDNIKFLAKGGVFLNPKTWGELEEQYKFTKRMATMELKRLGSTIVAGFTGGASR